MSPIGGEAHLLARSFRRGPAPDPATRLPRVSPAALGGPGDTLGNLAGDSLTQYTRAAKSEAEERLSNPPEPPSEARASRSNWRCRLRRARQPAIEIAAILLWSLWIGRDFLEFDPRLWPHGADYPLSIEPLYQWDLLRQCGSCVLWNGFFNGGAPAFLETHAAFLHPLVIALSLMFDPVTTSKIVLVLSLFLAGIAQWWLAHVLRFGSFPRLWSSLLAVAGGHLTGRMEMGLVWMVFSTATASLVLPPLLRLCQDGRRRDGVVIALLMASALLSGQGYIQIGLMLISVVFAVAFTLDCRLHLRPVWKELLRTTALVGLLAAILLIPLVNALPLLDKDLDDQMLSLQPLERIPLNYVVSDPEYYNSPATGALAFPAIYANYIGWIPAALFLVGVVRRPRRGSLRLSLALILPIPILAIFSSRLLPDLLPGPAPLLLAILRYPSLMLGLTVPLILAVAAWELNELWTRLPGLPFFVAAKPRVVRLVLLAAGSVLLWFSLIGPYRFSRAWMLVFPMPLGAQEIADHLVLGTTAWVQPPADYYWPFLLAGRGQKVTGVHRPWWVKGTHNPPASLQADRVSDNPQGRFDRVVQTIGLISHADVHYASIQSGQGTIACSAEAYGGRILVVCPETPPGDLVVTENRHAGWTATCDGMEVDLAPGPWLSVSSVAGPLICEFRYSYWDVPVGIGFSLLGMWAAASQWRFQGKPFRRGPRPSDLELMKSSAGQRRTG